jgi:ABC-2 type transport system ATP-binding protein
MHEPEVIFLDEPTSGVDPLARRAFWKMINRLADCGAAILVTTHYLEESEQCNRLGLMVAGELVAEGAPSALKAEQTGHLLEFIVDLPQNAADLLKTEMEPWRVALFGTRLHVITDEDAESGMRSIAATLEAHDIRLLSSRGPPKVGGQYDRVFCDRARGGSPRNHPAVRLKDARTAPLLT